MWKVDRTRYVRSSEEVQHEVESLVGRVAYVRTPVAAVSAKRVGNQIHEASVGSQIDDEHELRLDQVSRFLRHLIIQNKQRASKKRRG